MQVLGKRTEGTQVWEIDACLETKTFRHQARFTRFARLKFVHNKDCNVQVVNKDFKVVKKDFTAGCW